MPMQAMQQEIRDTSSGICRMLLLVLMCTHGFVAPSSHPEYLKIDRHLTKQTPPETISRLFPSPWTTSWHRSPNISSTAQTIQHRHDIDIYIDIFQQTPPCRPYPVARVPAEASRKPHPPRAGIIST
ncbi:hypothetical protein F5883DRAFT_183365 [Diaporthe sp. PMI_573]|nr:hypothetical protein F5883DRAFT_183365 [Diaporthaceae sp. PMI_573]